MIKRYEDELSNRIDRLVSTGSAHFEWWELYAWFNAERLGSKSYRDLCDRYVAAGGQGTLRYSDVAGGMMLIEIEKFLPLSDRM